VFFVDARTCVEGDPAVAMSVSWVIELEEVGCASSVTRVEAKQCGWACMHARVALCSIG
jgi:hypothetical protein